MKKAIAPEPLTHPLQKIFVLGVSTGLGLGYAPFAPGTFGSLLGIVLGLWLLKFPSWVALIVCAVLFVIFAKLADRAQRHWGQTDCQRIVSDEVLGQALALLCLRHAVDMETVHLGPWEFASPPLAYIAIGFALFRILDIVKPYPARTFDRRPTGVGVIADDIVAGLYASLILWGIARINHS